MGSVDHMIYLLMDGEVLLWSGGDGGKSWCRTKRKWELGVELEALFHLTSDLAGYKISNTSVPVLLRMRKEVDVEMENTPEIHYVPGKAPFLHCLAVSISLI